MLYQHMKFTFGRYSIETQTPSIFEHYLVSIHYLFDTLCVELHKIAKLKFNYQFDCHHLSKSLTHRTALINKIQYYILIGKSSIF